MDNIGHNLDEIRRHTMAEVMPCVKNNAYGHGLIPVSAYLSGRGVKRVMVAKLREAVRIRDLLGSESSAWTPCSPRSSLA